MFDLAYILTHPLVKSIIVRHAELPRLVRAQSIRPAGCCNREQWGARSVILESSRASVYFLNHGFNPRFACLPRLLKDHISSPAAVGHQSSPWPRGRDGLLGSRDEGRAR